MHRAIIVAALAYSPCALGAPPAAQIGIYHWGGSHSHSVAEGVGTIASLGGRVARVTLSPRSDRDYRIGSECRPGFSLATAAESGDWRDTLDNPAIETFIITAYDGASFGDCRTQRFLDPAFFTPENIAAVVKEYSDFTLHLYRTYRHTYKRFIVSNWEGDNAIYCGQSYAFATNAFQRAWCLSQYPAIYGVASPDEAFEGLRLWLRTRADGILDGRRRALDEGLGGMRVYFAPEFNIVHALHDHGFKSVLYDVLPFIMFDYVSYSAYESIGGPDPAQSLRADLDLIRGVIGSNAIIIGEVGFSRRVFRGETLARTDAAISAALDWGAPYVIQWRLYDDDPGDGFGIFDGAGSATELAGWFTRRVGGPEVK